MQQELTLLNSVIQLMVFIMLVMMLQIANKHQPDSILNNVVHMTSQITYVNWVTTVLLVLIQPMPTDVPEVSIQIKWDLQVAISVQ